MILPYHVQQAAYAATTALVVVTLWLLLGRVFRRALPRLIGTGAIVGLTVLAVALSAREHAGQGNVSGFRAIAFGYYGLGIVLPILGLIEMRRSKIALLLALPILALSLWAALIEPDRLQTREETIVVNRFNPGPEIRIAHISDLQTVGHCGREDEAARRINAFAPDLVLFSGDYIAGPFGDPEAAVAAARKFLSALHPRLGLVVVDGHSEPRLIREQIFRGLDVIYLKDEERVFQLEDGRRIRVFGSMVHDPKLERIQPPAGPEELAIVVSHMPDESPALSGRGVDLHLAGHTHGGQIVIPGFGAPMTLSSLPRRYARGLFRYEDHWLNVSAGIGTEGNHAPRIRLFCPPEICLLRITGLGEPIAR